MNDKALVVIDLQNDITKNYRNIIEKVNTAILWAQSVGMHIIYIKHNNITAGTRTLKPGTKGVGAGTKRRVEQYLCQDKKQLFDERGVPRFYQGERNR